MLNQIKVAAKITAFASIASIAFALGLPYDFSSKACGETIIIGEPCGEYSYLGSARSNLLKLLANNKPVILNASIEFVEGKESDFKLVFDADYVFVDGFYVDLSNLKGGHIKISGFKD